MITFFWPKLIGLYHMMSEVFPQAIPVLHGPGRMHLAAEEHVHGCDVQAGLAAVLRPAAQQFYTPLHVFFHNFLKNALMKICQ